jgi:hypothetical protein
MTMRGRALDLAGAAIVTAQLAASAWLVPAGDHVTLPGGAELGGLCWFRAAFHIDCPFCGMTRSFVWLAHGDVVAAWRFHPAGPLLFVAMLVFLGAVMIAGLRSSPPLVERRQFMRGFEAVAVTCLVIGVFKMVRRYQ